MYFIVTKWLPQLQTIYLHSSQDEKEKSPAFSVPSYQGHKNFSRNLPSLAPPQSLPLNGLLLLQSYWSELGYSAIPRCKEDWGEYPNWLRPVRIHCPNFDMLLPIYEQNQDSGSKEESSNGEQASWKQVWYNISQYFWSQFTQESGRTILNGEQPRLAFVYQSIRWKYKKILKLSLISKAEVIRVQTEVRPGRSQTPRGRHFLLAISRAGNGVKTMQSNVKEVSLSGNIRE